MAAAGILMAVLIALTPAAHCQTMTYGIDTARDAAAYARFNKHLDSIRQYRPTVALVLSGGGARGAAHVSIIRHLDSIGLHPDLVVGTSIGGLVGGLYACGYTGDELAEIFLAQPWDTLLRDIHSSRYQALEQKDYDRQHPLNVTFGKFDGSLFNATDQEHSILQHVIGNGVVEGQNIANLLSTLTAGHSHECDFLQLPIPFACVSSDMVSASPKVWHSGSLNVALRSTMSIPALFTPVKIDSMVLVDGAMRDNFPVDVAKALGADIVIGVDISAPSLQADEINTLIDIVAQTTDVMGRETYTYAKQATDIYIQPDVHEYSLLSFETDAIRQMMRRGETAVRQHARELDSVQRMMAAATPPPAPQHTATNLAHDTVAIRIVSFVGVNYKAEHYLRHLLDLPERVTAKELQNAIDIMMGTKVFESVTYTLLGPREPYILQFNCKPQATHRIGAGFRFDTKDMGAILLNVGLHTQRLTGSQYAAQIRIGHRSAIDLDYHYRTREGWDWGLQGLGENVTNGHFRYDTLNFQLNYRHLRGQAMVDITRWKTVVLRLGVLYDYWHRTTFLANHSIERIGIQPVNMANYAVFTRLRSDSYDDPYFPTQGLRTLIEGYLFLHNTPAVNARGSLQYAIPTHRRWLTLLPSASVLYASESLSLPYNNMLTMHRASVVTQQQTSFIGLNQTTLCEPFVATAALEMRFGINTRHYITAMGQALFYSDLKGDNSMMYGIGLEYAYKTLLGPLLIDIHTPVGQWEPGVFLLLGVDLD